MEVSSAITEPVSLSQVRVTVTLVDSFDLLQSIGRVSDCGPFLLP